MNSFSRFGSSSKSYLTSLTASTSPYSSTDNSGANGNVIDPSDDVDALRWKLFGKNEEFRIMHDAATTIQSFWRGCFSRTITSEKIETLIEDIMAFRKLEDDYKKRDEEEQQKQQHRRVQNHDPMEENDNNDDKNDSGLTGHVGVTRRKNKNKPWRTSMEDSDCGFGVTNLVTPIRSMSRVSEGDEEPLATNHASGPLESVDGDTRGYRRYRTNIHGKNKTRPWRDDTNVFDAY